MVNYFINLSFIIIYLKINIKYLLKMLSKKYHNFHIVNPSPWPLTSSIGVLALTFGLVLLFHNYQKGFVICLFGLFLLVSSMALWWRDVIREATFEGNHTKIVKKGLKIGMILFIVSEIMFFFSFFWAYFHSSLSPSIEIGSVWPPRGIDAFSPWQIPLLNTVILVSSGASITWTHSAIIKNNRLEVVNSFLITLFFAIFFTLLQLYEYTQATFDISDGIYGSIFFMSTGFHGFHVIIGTIFILVCLVRYLKHHFTSRRHLGFECAAWYWHFVDVVWLFLYIAVYWWGNEIIYDIPFFKVSNILLLMDEKFLSFFLTFNL